MAAAAGRDGERWWMASVTAGHAFCGFRPSRMAPKKSAVMNGSTLRDLMGRCSQKRYSEEKSYPAVLIPGGFSLSSSRDGNDFPSLLLFWLFIINCKKIPYIYHSLQSFSRAWRTHRVEASSPAGLRRNYRVLFLSSNIKFHFFMNKCSPNNSLQMCTQNIFKPQQSITS